MCTFKDYSLTSAICDLRSVKTGPQPFGSKGCTRTKGFHLGSRDVISHQNAFLWLSLHVRHSAWLFLVSLGRLQPLPHRQVATILRSKYDGIIVTALLQVCCWEPRCLVPPSRLTVTPWMKWSRLVRPVAAAIGQLSSHSLFRGLTNLSTALFPLKGVQKPCTEAHGI